MCKNYNICKVDCNRCDRKGIYFSYMGYIACKDYEDDGTRYVSDEEKVKRIKALFDVGGKTAFQMLDEVYEIVMTNIIKIKENNHE